jgi:hypothetical protein
MASFPTIGATFMAMKTMKLVSGLLLAGLLAFVGCGKSEKDQAQGIPATMDLSKFQQAFPSPTPEQQGNIAKASEGVRYSLYPNALVALDKLAADPALTEPQKKAVSDLIEGIKQTMAKAPAPPAR